jgi:hypothetical protein
MGVFWWKGFSAHTLVFSYQLSPIVKFVPSATVAHVMQLLMFS